MQKELLPYMGLWLQFQFSIYSTAVRQKETIVSQVYRIWRIDVKNLCYSEASSTCKENKYQDEKFTIYNHAMVFTCNLATGVAGPQGSQIWVQSEKCNNFLFITTAKETKKKKNVVYWHNSYFIQRNLIHTKMLQFWPWKRGKKECGSQGGMEDTRITWPMETNKQGLLLLFY